MGPGGRVVRQVEVGAKCPKYHHYIVKIEKILGISVTIVTVLPWISIACTAPSPAGFRRSRGSAGRLGCYRGTQ